MTTPQHDHAPSEPSEPSEPWYVASFRADYLDRYPHRSAAEADQAVTSVVPHLNLSDGACVLDVGCGAGRHITALLDCEHIDHVVGIDLSRDLLAVAHDRLAADVEAGRVELVQGDMRALPFAAGRFEAVVSFFTAFGYFEDDDENAQVVREAARVLKPGGAYSLDFLNAPFAIANLRPRDEEALPQPDGRTLRRTSVREYDAVTRRLDKRVEETLGDRAGNVIESRTLRESVRAFTRDELAGMVEAAGLRLREVLGEYTGEAWSETASRCIVIAAK